MVIREEQAIELLLSGEVVAVPTETVYGLAAIATIPSAIAKIFEIKKRPADNPLICHFYDISHVAAYVTHIPEPAQLLMDAFSPGPISYMLDLKPNSDLKFATSGRDQVIARIPGHSALLSIIKKIYRPLAAPSANTSGYVSPTSAVMVEADIGKKIPGIVDGGSSQIGLESTIIDARSSDELYILRPGAIGEKEINTVLPGIKISYRNKNETTIPGSKYRHYSPNVQIMLLNSYTELAGQHDAAVVMTEEDKKSLNDGLKDMLTENRIHILSLGSVSNLDDLARNFYNVLASINSLPVSKAFFVKTDFGNSSLGKALQNRLERITGQA